MADLLALQSNQLETLANKTLGSLALGKQSKKASLRSSESSQGNGRSEFSTADFLKRVGNWPSYRAELRVKATPLLPSPPTDISVNKLYISAPSVSSNVPKEPEWIDITTAATPLPIDCDCVLEIKLKCTRGSRASDPPLSLFTAPNTYQKAKSPSFWAVLGSVSSGELLAVRRLGSIGPELTTTLEFITPHEACTDDMCLYVVCDSLVGIDLETPFTVQTV